MTDAISHSSSPARLHRSGNAASRQAAFNTVKMGNYSDNYELSLCNYPLEVLKLGCDAMDDGGFWAHGTFGPAVGTAVTSFVALGS